MISIIFWAISRDISMAKYYPNPVVSTWWMRSTYMYMYTCALNMEHIMYACTTCYDTRHVHMLAQSFNTCSIQKYMTGCLYTRKAEAIVGTALSSLKSVRSCPLSGNCLPKYAGAQGRRIM